MNPVARCTCENHGQLNVACRIMLAAAVALAAVMVAGEARAGSQPAAEPPPSASAAKAPDTIAVTVVRDIASAGGKLYFGMAKV